MTKTDRALRFARALALGGALSGVTGCDRQSSTETPNTFSSGAALPTPADAGVATATNTAPIAPQNTTPPRRIAAGEPCSPVGARGDDLRPNGLVPCECVAAAGGARWVCDDSSMIMEGPLPPPELDDRVA